MQSRRNRFIISAAFGLISIIFLISIGLLIAGGYYFSIFYLVFFALVIAISINRYIMISKLHNIKDINSKELNINDIIILSYQDILNKDAKVTNGSILVDESSCSGSQEPVAKNVGDIVYKGSVVLSGNASVQILEENEHNIKIKNKNNHKLIDIICYCTAILAAVTAIISFIYYLNRDYSFKAYIGPFVAIIISVVPIGLYPLIMLSYLNSSLNLSRNSISVNSLYKIDALRNSDVVCLDKTGTLTDKNYVVSSIETLKENETYVKSMLFHILSAAGDEGRLSTALNTIAASTNKIKANAVLRFDVSNEYLGASFSNGTYLVGSPNKMNLIDKSLVLRKVQEYKARGYYPVVLAKGVGGITGDSYKNPCETIAIIVLEEKLKEGAEELISYLNKEGKIIKIISGDNPVLVSEMAKTLTIEYADKYISLKGKNDAEIAEIVKNYTIFGDVNASQKALIISLLKQQGHKVTYIGDGLNDVEAYSVADCSISLSESDADILIESNDLSSVIDLYKEGNVVANRVKVITSLFITKSLPLLLINVFLLVASLINKDLLLVSPFSIPAFYLIDFFIIGLPSLAICFERDEQKRFNNLTKNIVRFSIISSIILFLGLATIYMFYIYGVINQVYTSVVSVNSATNIAVMFMTVYMIGVSFRIYQQFTKNRLIIWISSVFAVIFAVGLLLLINLYFGKSTFLDIDFITMSTSNYLLLGSVSLGAITLFYVVSYIIDILKNKNKEEIE